MNITCTVFCDTPGVLFMKICIITQSSCGEIQGEFGIGIKLQGEEIKILRFFDGNVILLQTAEELEKHLNGMDVASKEIYKINIKKSKTSIMECSRIKSGDVANGISEGHNKGCK